MKQIKEEPEIVFDVKDNIEKYYLLINDMPKELSEDAKKTLKIYVDGIYDDYVKKMNEINFQVLDAFSEFAEKLNKYITSIKSLAEN